VLVGVPSAATQDIFDPASGRLLVENNAGAQPQRTYIYLNGMPIALVSGFSSINYVLSDQLGQPQKLVDGFSTLVWDRVSDEFGATVSQAKGLSTAISLRFPGQEYDAITGLHYNDQRDYDPTLGRYIQPDPIGLAGGINTYAYADGNPLSNADRFGLCDKEKCAQLLDKMNNLVNATRASGSKGFKGLAQRFRQLANLPPAEIPGHTEQIQGRQRQLQKVIQDYIDSGCGDPPAFATEFANKAIPDSQDQDQNSFSVDPQTQQQSMQNAAGAGTVIILSILTVLAF